MFFFVSVEEPYFPSVEIEPVHNAIDASVLRPKVIGCLLESLPVIFGGIDALIWITNPVFLSSTICDEISRWVACVVPYEGIAEGGVIYAVSVIDPIRWQFSCDSRLWLLPEQKNMEHKCLYKPSHKHSRMSQKPGTSDQVYRQQV
jgi:hypothetical protein